MAAAELLLELATLLIAHGFHRHRDVSNVLDILYRSAGIGLDGGLHGAASDGEVDFHGHVITGDGNGLHHVEFGDGAADFGVFDAGECLAYGGFSNNARHNPCHLSHAATGGKHALGVESARRSRAAN